MACVVVVSVNAVAANMPGGVHALPASRAEKK
jgi:hypothetical protein